MNEHDLLDAIGMIDDRFLKRDTKVRTISFRRVAVALAAVIALVILSVGTAMAVSEEFRNFVFSVIHIETHEHPPAGTTPTFVPGESLPSNQPGLREVDTVQIEGKVEAHYFSTGGYVMPFEGGFYTCEWKDPGTAPQKPAFWELTEAGMMEKNCIRVDFLLNHKGKDFRILFDYAILGKGIRCRVWPEGLDEDPYGNGWNATALADRTDVMLLTIPVEKNNDYTQDFLILDMKTLETRNLLENIGLDDIVVYAGLFSDDLRYGILYGHDGESARFWLCDLEGRTIHTIDHVTDKNVSNGPEYYPPYFLDSETIVLRAWQEDGAFDLIRYHIPEKQTVVLEEKLTPEKYRSVQNSGWVSYYGMLSLGADSYELIDLRTNERIRMSGLRGENLKTSESPDGNRIMISFYDETGYSQLGMLNPSTGRMKMLTRERKEGSEYFWGWLDNTSVVLTARDAQNGYWVYVYDFEPEHSGTVPLQPQTSLPEVFEPADDQFVKVADYIPDLVTDLRYAGEDNFTGERIYGFSDAWLRYGTVKKLMAVQADLKERGLSLKIWDAFRPVSAQFTLWEVCPDPTYVANPNNGFSSHSRGNTVDVTLVYADGSEAKMPTGFDNFSKLADRDYSDCGEEAARNAKLLEEIMTAHGFSGYFGEWWHFSDTVRYEVEKDFDPSE